MTRPLRFFCFNSRTLMESCGFRNGIRGTPPVPSRFGADVCKFRFIFSLTPARSCPHALARTLSLARAHTFFLKRSKLGRKVTHTRVLQHYNLERDNEAAHRRLESIVRQEGGECSRGCRAMDSDGYRHGQGNARQNL